MKKKYSELTEEQKAKQRAASLACYHKYKEKNSESRKESKKRYWAKARYKLHARHAGDKTCLICEIKLASRFAWRGKKLLKLCEDCQNNPKVKTFLDTMRTRRWKQRKRGLPVEPVTREAFFHHQSGRRPWTPMSTHKKVKQV